MDYLRVLLTALLVVPSSFGGVHDNQVLQFTLKTLEGRSVNLTVRENMREDRLAVEMDSLQKICFDDYLGLSAARVLDDAFLELEFSVRGGTGLSVAEYYLISVSSGVLRVAFSGEAIMKSDQTDAPCPDSIREVKELDVWEHSHALRRRVNDYTLKVIQHHLFRSECKASENAETNDTFELRFDKDYGVFLSRIDTISGEFRRSYDSPGTRLDNVVCPVIPFRKGESDIFFFKEGWYFQSRKGLYLCGSGLNCD